ncbi:MAG TPA: hypothetical protein VKU02_12345 [Gemmataceae bacterium]|nr:hypothetical protein [Gemmataceae bacterium]
MASPVARLQAAVGSVGTDLRHEGVTLSDLDRQMLLLDGSRSPGTLLEQLIDWKTRGLLRIHSEGQPVASEDSGQQMLRTALDRCLAGLANGALLMG